MDKPRPLSVRTPFSYQVWGVELRSDGPLEDDDLDDILPQAAKAMAEIEAKRMSVAGYVWMAGTLYAYTIHEWAGHLPNCS